MKKKAVKFDVDGRSKRDKKCATCFGTGKVYCCDTFEYLLALLSNDDTPLEHSVLPHFPLTNLEMSRCPFCGDRLRRLINGKAVR